MQKTQNAFNGNEYRSIPITALVESASNPRKRFDEKSLEELAASFKTQGVLAPLLVRELDESKYEVVAGVKLTDAEAIEAQVVELSVLARAFFVDTQRGTPFTCKRRAAFPGCRGEPQVESQLPCSRLLGSNRRQRMPSR